MEYYRNKKSKKLYLVISEMITDATNGENDKEMVLYRDRNNLQYFRDRKEFHKKFKKAKV